MHATFAEQLSAMLHFYNIHPQSIALEITESSMIFKHGEVRQALNDISKLGVELHLDDFGTGYSSLSMLHDLPISTVKLDKSFVHGSHKGSKAIVQATHAICDKLGLKVVAEGVETETQKDLLIDCGYQYLQGFLSVSLFHQMKSKFNFYPLDKSATKDLFIKWRMLIDIHRLPPTYKTVLSSSGSS